MIRPFLLAALALAAPARPASLQLADSFRIGSTGVLCTAQARIADPALTTMFDRGYRIVCRDAAAPVGELHALRGGVDRLAPFTAARADGATCAAPQPADIPQLPGAMVARCDKSGLAVSVYSLVRGKTLYVADGLGGYGPALRLGLRSIVADATIPGDLEVATTEAGDSAAFARVQAGTLDPAQALAEGYVRNNAASFAESAEFFDLLLERNRLGTPGFNRSAEYLANLALQQSNLGSFDEADALFGRAAQALDPADPIVTRLYRNFRTIHELNRRRPAEALARLAAVAVADTSGLELDRLAAGNIDVPLAQRLNADDEKLRGLAGVTSQLTAAERIILLDAQAEYLRGAALRMAGDAARAGAALADASGRLGTLRQGRIATVFWLRAQIAGETAVLAEAAGQPDAARAAHDSAIAIFRTEFPGSAALLVAEARLAGFLARQSKPDEAATLFRSVIAASPATSGAGPAVRGLVAPYFALLVDRGAAAAADVFDASQILVRPGVAQTQAVLARELSGGSDAAAGQFRQSLALSRDIVRVEQDIARLAANLQPAPEDAALLATLNARREALGRDQTAVLAALSGNPRYAQVSNSVVTLASLQAQLRSDEAYYKLILVGDAAYALLATPDAARSFRIDADPTRLGTMVAALRDTIVKIENGRPATYPFDAATARRLYRVLFDPVAAEMANVRHLVFEPDGALLQLPVNLLIAADDGLAAYRARVDDPAGDPFDMRGIAWLGRSRSVSTAVSPRAFLDIRAIAPSGGARAYLGLGRNAPPAAPVPRNRCDWPLADWRNPISDSELRIGAALAGGGDITTGADFSDTALIGREDLRQYRVIHFATHGLVTAPRPECPARPALLTSFGGPASDGLLSFREIFDLGLDADTIILSACDTAGTATTAATRDAGIATGGNFALDGLVRAFVGAGARAVIASHWPVPDNYDATRTLITGLFSDAGRISVGEALRRSQVGMMDIADTSHPYYWSGFAIVGDAAKPLAGALQPVATAAN